MCLSPLFDVPSPVPDFIQYFELNRLLGAEKFIVYNHSMNALQYNEILEYYKETDVAEVIQWRLPKMVGEQVWYKAQMLTIVDCMYRIRGLSTYMVTSDVDEYIVPMTSPTWQGLLNSQNTACEYNIRSTVLIDAPDKYKFRRNLDRKQAVSSALAREYRSTHIWEHTIKSKYIALTACLANPGIHHVWKYRLYKYTQRVNVDPDKALVFHYRNPQFEDKTFVNETRMDAFSETLTSRIQDIQSKVSDRHNTR